MLVVDASVAIKLLVPEVGTDRARDLLRLPDPLIAPDWILIEAANTFWRKVKRSELLMVHAERHLDDLPMFFKELLPSRELVTKASRLSFQLRHSVYDCLYLALAIREECPLVTADEGLIAAMNRGGFGKLVRPL